MSVLSRDGRAREIHLEEDEDDITQALALANKCPAERVFRAERGHTLTAQIDERLGLQRASDVGHPAGRILGPVL